MTMQQAGQEGHSAVFIAEHKFKLQSFRVSSQTQTLTICDVIEENVNVITGRKRQRFVTTCYQQFIHLICIRC